MAAEITTQFALPEAPAALMQQWGDTPPGFLAGGQNPLGDGAFAPLVCEAAATSVGTRLLMFGSAKTLYRLMIKFESDGATGTRLTITGQAIEKVRDRIAEAAAEHGGP